MMFGGGLKIFFLCEFSLAGQWPSKVSVTPEFLFAVSFIQRALRTDNELAMCSRSPSPFDRGTSAALNFNFFLASIKFCKKDRFDGWVICDRREFAFRTTCSVTIP